MDRTLKPAPQALVGRRMCFTGMLATGSPASPLSLPAAGDDSDRGGAEAARGMQHIRLAGRGQNSRQHPLCGEAAPVWCTLMRGLARWRSSHVTQDLGWLPAASFAWGVLLFAVCRCALPFRPAELNAVCASLPCRMPRWLALPRPWVQEGLFLSLQECCCWCVKHLKPWRPLLPPHASAWPRCGQRRCSCP